jgi:phage regulator Rha-like protein
MLSELSPEVAVETVSVEPAADGEPRVDSRKLAGPMGVQHPHLFRLLKTHEADFAEMGIVSFQNGLTGKRGMPQRYAMLNEDQAYLLLAYVKNTPEARQLKKHLIVAFRRAREALEGRVSVDSVSLEEAFKIERAHGAAEERGRIGGHLLSKWRYQKPIYENAMQAIRVELQLVLPWGHKEH